MARPTPRPPWERALARRWLKISTLGASLSCSPTDFCAPGTYECSPAIEPNTDGGAGDGTAGQGGAAGTPGALSGGAAGSGGAPIDVDGAGGVAGQAGAPGDAGAAGSENPPDDSCNPGAPVDGCTLRDDTGIYVDPATGDDAALGTRDAPLASAAKALRIAADLGKPVYVCNAVFDEHLEATDGVVALRGGYACPGDERGAWTYDGEERAMFRPISSGVVLTVRDVDAFTVSDVDFVATDALSAGESSVAAFVVASTNVRFSRVALQAGEGKDGADGVLEPFSLPAPLSLNGNDGVVNVPGAAKECQCPAGDVTRGGAAATFAAAATPGEPDWGAGAAGTAGACAVARGADGGNAPNPLPGTGAVLRGRLSPDGWSPESGGDGPHGSPGQGGGGSAAPDTNGHGGGGGACGGCGGRGGPGGGGGGASIALLALDSEVRLEHASLVASDAGDGGNGSGGQAGQTGGNGGVAAANFCPGGDGGAGGDGAAGGGGAGGVSAAVAFLRSTVTPNSATTLDAGNAGEGGVGGIAGVNDGANGVRRLELDLERYASES